MRENEKDERKNVMKKNRLFMSFLSILLCLLMLASCNTAEQPTETTEAPKETEAPVEKILLADLENYILIRPEVIGDVLASAVSKFKKDFETSTGVESLRLKDDFFREGVESLKINEFEILVGRTNRPESQEYLSTLRYNDYGYTVINKKIVIAGHTEETTELAIKLFTKEVLLGENEEGVFMNGVAVTVKGEYKTENMKLNGLPVKGMKVVYTGANKLSEKAFANEIASVLSSVSGYYVPSVTDKNLELAETDNIILVGDSERIDRFPVPEGLASSEGFIGTNSNTILVAGGGSLGLYCAVNEFIDRIEKSNGVELTLKAEEKFDSSSNTTRVMSFNVWVSQKTTERTNRVLQMITKYMPDSFGVQEASPAWMTSLRSGLSAYAYVGGGRDGGSNGEHSAIFYLKDKYTVLESGTKWLSATPDSVSKFEESSLNRICTYAVLQEKATGKVYVHVNTHFDHTSNTAREKQARVFMDIVAQFKGYPVVLTGDFNCTPGSDPYKVITAAGFLNSSEVATEKHGSATFHGNGSSSSIIDFCFLTPGKMAAINYRVCDEKIDGGYVSDHHPVFVDFIY